MIHYKFLNKAQLWDFVSSHEFDQMRFIPITRHRALSHINNPRAEENDILMILAYAENELAGYLGILPDLVFSSGVPYNCGSFSCIWVNPEIRGQGIAAALTEKAHELYDKIVVAEFVPATLRMYERTKLFAHPVVFEGVRLYMRMDLHSILPPKSKSFHRIKLLLQAGDALANFFLDTRFLFRRSKLDANIQFVSEVDDEAGEFINRFSDKQLFKRNQQELNWIIKYPWILNATKHDRDKQRYHFTSTEKSFNLFCVKIRSNDDKLIAFLILSRRNRVLKLPYCFMEPYAVSVVANVITQHIYKWKINTFTAFHPQLSRYFLSHNIGVIHKKVIRRSYLFSNELHELISKSVFEIQDGDADLAFT